MRRPKIKVICIFREDAKKTNVEEKGEAEWASSKAGK